jgi:hypothetical protein
MLKETKVRASFGHHDWSKRKLMHANIAGSAIFKNNPKPHSGTTDMI